MKVSKSLISCFLIIMMLLSITSSVLAKNEDKTGTYVALGDSTSFGLSDIRTDGSFGGGYSVMFRNHIDPRGINYTYNNLSWPGDKTSDLINTINSNEELIKNATIITINIGGNNLLGPFMQTIAGMYGLDLSSYPEDDLNGSQFMTDLYGRISADIAAGGNPLAKVAQLQDPNNPYTNSLNQALQMGLAQFVIEWQQIIAKVKELAPNAKIYANTIFNPAMVSSTEDPMYNFYMQFDQLIEQMNAVIRAGSTPYGYECVDVYSAFKASEEEVVTFNIVNAIAALRQGDIAGFKKSIDPHPTTFGHRLIYQKLKLLYQ